jgi:hypothetical protein
MAARRAYVIWSWGRPSMHYLKLTPFLPHSVRQFILKDQCLSLQFPLIPFHDSSSQFFHVHGQMVRGGCGLPKVSPAPAMLNLSKPCGQATSETNLQPFQEWLTHRAGSLRPSSTPLDTPHRMPMSFPYLVIVESKCGPW